MNSSIKLFHLGVPTADRPSFTVIFKDEDGTVLKTDIVLYGNNAIPPPDPGKGGKTGFDYWDPNYYNITRDLVIIAVYKESKYG